jgi:hypothetical protein
MEEYIIKPVIEIDGFTNNKLIKFSFDIDYLLFGFVKFRTYNSAFGAVFFYVSLNHLQGKDYIVFRITPKKAILKVGDKVSLLFTNDSKIEFTITLNSYKVHFPNSADEAKEIISLDELNILITHELKAWKITFCKEAIEVIGDNTTYYESSKSTIHEKLDNGLLLKELAKTYSDTINEEIENYSPLVNREFVDKLPMALESICYVYLMIDTTNGYHKIGISNSPDYREKTLQSEKPSVELLASKKFINRRMAQSFEKALHDTYLNKRVRGEWFNLSQIEIDELRYTLDN